MFKFLKALYGFILIAAIGLLSFALYHYINTDTAPWDNLAKSSNENMIEKSFDPSDINSIIAEVSSEDLKIIRSDSDKVVVKYPEKSLIELDKNNKTLKAINKKTAGIHFFIGINISNLNGIIIELPDAVSLDKLEAYITSGDITIDISNKINSMRINDMSGDIDIKNVSFNSADLTNKSGDTFVNISREFESLTVNNTSGDIGIKNSGDIELNILKAVSSSGDVNFGKKYDDILHDKNGRNKVILNTFSGDIDIH